MKTDFWIRAACGVICAGGGAVLAFLLFRYGFGILLPFLIAFAISAAVRGAAGWLKRKTGLHSGAGNLILLLLVMLLVVSGVVFLGGKLVRQAEELIRDAGEYLNDPDNFLRQAAGKLDEFAEKWRPDKTSGGIGDTVYRMATELLQTALTRITGTLARWAGNLLASLPGTLVGLVIGIIALFYLCLDYDKVRAALAACLPEGLRRGAGRLRERLRHMCGGYVRAYFLLFLITYAQLLAGFLVLRVRHAVAVGLLIAVVDVLPVLGVGTVLVPWSAVCLLGGDYYRGVGLLILFGIICGVRQVAEPKLVGKCIGIHPLTALLAVYAGYRLFGVTGMILGPVAAYFLKWLLGAGRGAPEEKNAAPAPVPDGNAPPGRKK